MDCETKEIVERLFSIGSIQLERYEKKSEDIKKKTKKKVDTKKHIQPCYYVRVKNHKGRTFEK